MLRQIHQALKPGGRLVLLEYRKEDPAIPIRPEHKMSVAEAKMELEAEGFKLTRVDDGLPRQHVLIFHRSSKDSYSCADEPALASCCSRNPRFCFCFCRSCSRCIRHASRGTARTATGCCSLPASSSTRRAAADYVVDARIDRVQLLDGDRDRTRSSRDARRARLRRHASRLTVAVNLVVLGIFKYANFFADNVNALLPP